MKQLLTQEIQDTMKRPNLRIIGIDETEDFQLKGSVSIFNKIIEENIPNLKKEMPMVSQPVRRTEAPILWSAFFLSFMWSVKILQHIKRTHTPLCT